MCIKRKPSGGGFCLLEMLIGATVLLIAAGGIYASGMLSATILRYNTIASGARALATQKIEEVAAGGKSAILSQIPYDAETIMLEDRFEIQRETSIVGHQLDGTVVSNLVDSAYLEVSVYVSFYSHLGDHYVTNSFTTIVLD